MSESKTRVLQSDKWLVTMVDLLGDEQLVDLALGVGCERDLARDLAPEEQEHIRSIKAELLFRLRNSRQVHITMRD